MIKITKQEKQFMIQYYQANRDFLNNISLFYLSFGISVTAIILSIIALFSSAGFNVITTTISIALAILIIPLLCWCGNEAKKNITNAKKVNAQLQKKLFELYPEYKNKYH